MRVLGLTDVTALFDFCTIDITPLQRGFTSIVLGETIVSQTPFDKKKCYFFCF